MISRTCHTPVGECGAVFSDCENYRYRLWREWDGLLPTLCFLLLNPSSATEQTSDPTVARCETRAVRLGYGRLEVVNLFPWRAMHSRDLSIVHDPVGPLEQADRVIVDAVERADMVICGWGSHHIAAPRAERVVNMIRIAGYAARLHYLGLNRDGSPQHPLYIAMDARPKRLVA